MFDKLDPQQLKKAIANPFYCLPQVHEIFIQEHDPLITENEWIIANAKLMSEIGSEEWLKLLLDNLKGNYV